MKCTEDYKKEKDILYDQLKAVANNAIKHTKKNHQKAALFYQMKVTNESSNPVLSRIEELRKGTILIVALFDNGKASEERVRAQGMDLRGADMH